MRLGLLASQFGPHVNIDYELILEAERLGFSSVWTAEAYGSDAIVPLSFIATKTTTIGLGTAIMQMPARSPAMTAMTAMTLDQLSGGRFHIGLGPSGPQVVEGWHGVAYGRPLTRTREYISILRKIFAREGRLEHEGYHYQIPYRGEAATGLGKPLASILHGRADIEIYTAAVTPKGLACAGEVADGVFPLWMDPGRAQLLVNPISAGIAKSQSKSQSGKNMADFDLAPFVTCVLGDDIERCRLPVKSMLALYIGGMGARNKNFYNDYAKRLGYEEAAEKIQSLYLGGMKKEAVAAVPDELVDAIALVGPTARIAERVDVWKESPATSLMIAADQPEALRLLAELIL